MAGDHVSAASTNFYITAALLALFGLAALNQAGPHGPLQLVLAVVMGVAGFLLRTGTAEARLIGLGAAGLTTAVGAVLLVTGGFYVPGTIISVIALFQLVNAPGRAGHPGAAPTPAHLQAHLPVQLPPWSPAQGAPVPAPPAALPTPPAAPAAQPAAGQDWDYFGKPT